MNSVIISHNVDNEIMALGCQTPTSLFMTRYENYFNAGIELIFLEKVNLQSGLLLLLLLPLPSYVAHKEDQQLFHLACALFL